MITFLVSLFLLISGYFVYGRFVERIFQPDTRPTPAIQSADGVDYVAMPTWKVFLIQLLNIAGTGPIFGALMGAVFGPVVFLWIVFGCILGGAVHDYFTGMISVRYNGASISEIVGQVLGRGMKQVMRIFSVLLLVLVGTVFVTSPATLLALLTPDKLSVAFWVALILCYYLLATLLPIDKLIGKLYPIFQSAYQSAAGWQADWKIISDFRNCFAGYGRGHCGRTDHPRIPASGVDAVKSSSSWKAGLAVSVCHCGLRRCFRFSCDAVADDGALYAQ